MRARVAILVALGAFGSPASAVAYEVRLVGTSTPAIETAGEPALLYKPELGAENAFFLELHEPGKEYPVKPCGLDDDRARTLPLPEIRPFLESRCPKVMYAHDKDQVRSVRVTNLEVRIVDGCSGAELSVGFRTNYGFRPPLFWSTFGREGKSAFIAPASLRLRKLPFALPAEVAAPPGVKKPRWVAFRYPTGPSDMVIVAVRGAVDFVTPDPDKFGPSGARSWQRVFLVGPDHALPLTPDGPTEPIYFGGSDFEFGGLLDVDGDGKLDLLIGEQPTLVLRRTPTGFFAHGFPYYPPGGC